MKLKKIASLMLAGVMAISMLAGCSGKGETKPEEPATGVNANTVIAALDAKTTEKVTFTASASLQATADKAMTYVDDEIAGKTFDVALLKQIDKNLNNAAAYLPKTDTNTAATDMKAQTAIFVFESSNSLLGASDEFIVKDLAKQIDNEPAADPSLLMSAMPAKSGEYTDTNTSEKYFFNFTYTADVAVVSEANDQGQVSYYAVVVLTRTPAREAVKA